MTGSANPDIETRIRQLLTTALAASDAGAAIEVPTDVERRTLRLVADLLEEEPRERLLSFVGTGKGGVGGAGAGPTRFTVRPA
jgi:hypothetical protein